MVKKTTPSDPLSDRQAKINAAAKVSSSTGPNKIVVGAIVAVVAVIALVVTMVMISTSQRNKAAGNGKEIPKAAEGMGKGYVAYGKDLPDTAPRLDIYEDFQCPICKQLFEDRFGPSVTKLGTSGKAKIVYHLKTFLDNNLSNTSSMEASMGTLCAADQGKFVEYHETVFKNQPQQEGQGWTAAQLESFAKSSGLTGSGLTTWKECVKAKKYGTYLSKVEEISTRDDKVTGTPTLWINKKPMPANQLATFDTAEKFEAAVLAGK